MGLIQTLKSALRQRAAFDPELAYLNEATSRVDLELRQREVDRGRFRNLPRRG
ncbi:MAG: DUF3563 domain-containing protein [Devosia sp.]